MVIAYIDPSVMSYTVQAVAGVAIAFGVVIGTRWRKMKRGAKKALGIKENEVKETEGEIERRD